MEPTTLESYLPALGFSAIFLLMLKFVWDYFTKKIAELELRFTEMLKEQQLRYDRLQEKYIIDLGVGAAVNPRYSSWVDPTEDTQVRRGTKKSFNPNLSSDEYERGIDQMNK